MKQLLHTESVLHENTPQPIPIEVTRQIRMKIISSTKYRRKPSDANILFNVVCSFKPNSLQAGLSVIVNNSIINPGR